MKDKPLNYRQSLFVKYYLTNVATRGNATQSAVLAGYKWKYANLACKFLLGNIRVKATIEAEKVIIEAGDVNSREFVTKEMLSQYAKNKDKKPTEAIRALENLGKNCGWYALDNAQKAEQVKLDKAEAAEARRIANIINLEEARKGKVG